MGYGILTLIAVFLFSLVLEGARPGVISRGYASIWRMIKIKTEHEK